MREWKGATIAVAHVRALLLDVAPAGGGQLVRRVEAVARGRVDAERAAVDRRIVGTVGAAAEIDAVVREDVEAAELGLRMVLQEECRPRAAARRPRVASSSWWS
jgi:hypothetical protein